MYLCTEFAKDGFAVQHVITAASGLGWRRVASVGGLLDHGQLKGLIVTPCTLKGSYYCFERSASYFDVCWSTKA